MSCSVNENQRAKELGSLLTEGELRALSFSVCQYLVGVEHDLSSPKETHAALEQHRFQYF